MHWSGDAIRSSMTFYSLVPWHSSGRKQNLVVEPGDGRRVRGVQVHWCR